jgi:hypothetical protein
MRRTGLIRALLIALGAAVYGLDRGIYVGSSSFVVGEWIVKHCRYLFFTGISTKPARVLTLDFLTSPPGGSPPEQADAAYCPVLYK